ncbi:MAG: DUF2149 domain-containing protein [Oscillospiraceae bacterium]|jgi:hypothetical protein|nr:DUF2149 domain-containing protein [Oscillospiraceae bacterium]
MTGKLSSRRRGSGPPPLVNPADGIINLADVMLVLAVGIMLALVVNWNVDLAAASPQTEPSIAEESDLTFSEDDIQPAEDDSVPDDSDLTALGTVYYDKTTGKYYIVSSEG